MIWQFPKFYFFVICFSFIGILTIYSIQLYIITIRKITATLYPQAEFKIVNDLYYKYFDQSALYIIIPLSVVIIFGVGGCVMFGAIEYTPTLIWVLCLFTFVVYISIIGYIQYIALAFYIKKLSSISGKYTNLPKALIEYIPSRLEWLQELTKLTHTYRFSFFTLGSCYIAAFSTFCWLPEMNANTESYFFYLLWGIIILAIVILFPIVSILEYIWIKVIVDGIKKSYVDDLQREKNKSINGLNKSSESYVLQQYFETLCVAQIMNSDNYPISSSFSSIYAATLTFVNFIASIASILQTPTINQLINACLQKF